NSVHSGERENAADIRTDQAVLEPGRKRQGETALRGHGAENLASGDPRIRVQGMGVPREPRVCIDVLLRDSASAGDKTVADLEVIKVVVESREHSRHQLNISLQALCRRLAWLRAAGVRVSAVYLGNR